MFMFYALWGCNLFCNFHAPQEGGRWFYSNLSNMMTKVEIHAMKVRLMTAVRKNGVTEIRAYFPVGHKPIFVSKTFCNYCEQENKLCRCVQEVMQT